MEADRRGITNLLMKQAPVTAARMGESVGERYLIAQDVSRFALRYWNPSASQWLTTWSSSNIFPKLVKIEVGLGGNHHSPATPRDTAICISAIDASAVAPVY